MTTVKSAFPLVAPGTRLYLVDGGEYELGVAGEKVLGHFNRRTLMFEHERVRFTLDEVSVVRLRYLRSGQRNAGRWCSVDDCFLAPRAGARSEGGLLVKRTVAAVPRATALTDGVLAALRECGDLATREIAERLACARSTATRALHRLERANVVVQQPRADCALTAASATTRWRLAS